MKYVVEGTGNLRHNGQLYPAGQVVEMEPDEAKSLLEIGRLAPKVSDEQLNHQEDAPAPAPVAPEPVPQVPAPQAQPEVVPPAVPEAPAPQQPFPQPAPAPVTGQPSPSEVAATAAAVDGRTEPPAPQAPAVNLQ